MSFTVPQIRTFFRALTLLFGTAAWAGSGHGEENASPWVEADHARARLLAAGRFDHQGQKITAAAIEIVLDEGWKTYWRYPGEGLPPSFDWEKSGNVEKISVLWPAPRRLEEFGGLSSAGYKGRVILPVSIEPKDAGQPVQLRLSMTYGVCEEICIPVDTELALDMVLSSNGGHNELIAAALNRVPKQQTSSSDCPHRFVTAEIKPYDGKRALKITTENKKADDVAFFAEPPEGLFLPTPVLEQSDPQSGRQTYRIAMDDATVYQELQGSLLRFTTVSKQGSCESTWRMR